jgi:hypothetical protein
MRTGDKTWHDNSSTCVLKRPPFCLKWIP